MSAWDDLSMHERHQFIRTAVKNGIRDPLEIRKQYNSFEEGGSYNVGTLPEVTVIANPEPYNNFLNTLPSNLKNTSEAEYRMHRYWELNGKPSNFREAVDKGMFSKENDGYYHARSVAENPETGDYEFMKYPNHPTINMELDWYNSPEGRSFKRDYKLDTTSEPYYMYRRRAYGGPLNKPFSYNPIPKVRY